jgi:hypothetical protein
MSKKYNKIKVLAKDIRPGDKLRALSGYHIVVSVDHHVDRTVITKRTDRSVYAQVVLAPTLKLYILEEVVK